MEARVRWLGGDDARRFSFWNVPTSDALRNDDDPVSDVPPPCSVAAAPRSTPGCVVRVGTVGARMSERGARSGRPALKRSIAPGPGEAPLRGRALEGDVNIYIYIYVYILMTVYNVIGPVRAVPSRSAPQVSRLFRRYDYYYYHYSHSNNPCKRHSASPRVSTPAIPPPPGPSDITLSRTTAQARAGSYGTSARTLGQGFRAKGVPCEMFFVNLTGGAVHQTRLPRVGPKFPRSAMSSPLPLKCTGSPDGSCQIAAPAVVGFELVA